MLQKRGEVTRISVVRQTEKDDKKRKNKDDK